MVDQNRDRKAIGPRKYISLLICNIYVAHFSFFWKRRVKGRRCLIEFPEYHLHLAGAIQRYNSPPDPVYAHVEGTRAGIFCARVTTSSAYIYPRSLFTRARVCMSVPERRCIGVLCMGRSGWLRSWSTFFWRAFARRICEDLLGIPDDEIERAKGFSTLNYLIGRGEIRIYRSSLYTGS